MATAEQIKALLRAHFESNDEKFRTIALQIAAHEAKIGHTSNAREIKALIQNPKYRRKNNVVNIGPRLDTLELRYTDTKLSDLVVTDSLATKLSRILNEYRNRNLLRKNGLKNRSKLLLVGDPGTGKTMTASILSSELGLPLYTIQLEQLITKYMGETSLKLKQVFDQAHEVPGVYFFDEFDAIGSDRALDNDVGEMRRILNSFLVYLEKDDSYSIVVTATNNVSLLDKALFRRFDDVLEYTKPDKAQIEQLLRMKLSNYALTEVFSASVYEKALGLSHADVVKACENAIKYYILYNREITNQVLLMYLQERVDLYKHKEA